MSLPSEHLSCTEWNEGRVGMGVMEDAIYPASVILSPFNLMSDFAIRLGHATDAGERDLKSIGAKANVIKGEERGRERGRIKLNRELCR